MTFCKVSERGATIATRSHWSARKRPAGHTAGLFFIPRNTPVRSPHERTLHPAKTPRHRIR